MGGTFSTLEEDSTVPRVAATEPSEAATEPSEAVTEPSEAATRLSRVISELEEFIKSNHFPDCSVCSGKLTQVNVRVLKTCNHYFCSDCLKKMKGIEYKYSRSCPICRFDDLTAYDIHGKDINNEMNDASTPPPPSATPPRLERGRLREMLGDVRRRTDAPGMTRERQAAFGVLIDRAIERADPPPNAAPGVEARRPELPGVVRRGPELPGIIERRRPESGRHFDAGIEARRTELMRPLRPSELMEHKIKMSHNDAYRRGYEYEMRMEEEERTMREMWRSPEVPGVVRRGPEVPGMPTDYHDGREVRRTELRRRLEPLEMTQHKSKMRTNEVYRRGYEYEMKMQEEERTMRELRNRIRTHENQRGAPEQPR